MKKKVAFFAVLLAGTLLAACHKQAKEPVSEVESEAKEEVSEAETWEEEEGEGFSFQQVADREFYFSSGAGGWYTVLYIHEDGSFDGHYMDSDMGVTGEKYPNGTIYYSEFFGRFTEPKRIGEYTYAFQVASIEYPCGFEDEYKDGCHYCYTDAYGLSGAGELHLYLPGAKIADLPNAYRSWVGYYDPDSVSETELPFYGLYNVEQETGFSSYVGQQEEASEPQEEEVQEETSKPQEEEEVQEETSKPQQEEEKETAPAQKEYVRQMEEILLAAEEEAIALETELNAASDQFRMNEISEQLYQVWDEALNGVWKVLKKNLDKGVMAALTEEERTWIEEKEEAVRKAGEEYAGGSMQALVTNQEAARLTKERVYELKERFS